MNSAVEGAYAPWIQHTTLSSPWIGLPQPNRRSDYCSHQELHCFGAVTAEPLLQVEGDLLWVDVRAVAKKEKVDGRILLLCGIQIIKID